MVLLFLATPIVAFLGLMALAAVEEWLISRDAMSLRERAVAEVTSHYMLDSAPVQLTTMEPLAREFQAGPAAALAKTAKFGGASVIRSRVPIAIDPGCKRGGVTPSSETSRRFD